MESGDSDLIERARRLPVALTWPFTTDQVTAVRHALRDWIDAHGLSGDVADDFLVAVHELVINAAWHGGGSGVCRLRAGAGVLMAEVSDQGPGFAAGVPGCPVLPATGAVGGRGLAMARRLTDAMTIAETPDGVTAVVAVALPAARTAVNGTNWAVR